MKRLYQSALIALPIFLVTSCDKSADEQKPGTPPGSDFRLRSVLAVKTLGGRYQTPSDAKTAALIVRFFENGKQVGRGPVLSLPIEEGILDCEFLVRGNTGHIFSPHMGSTDLDDFYEKVGKSWTNTGSGNFTELPHYQDVQILGFLTSGIDHGGKELAGTPDFKYHIQNASHLVALFAVLSENAWKAEGANLSSTLEMMDLGIQATGHQQEAEQILPDQSAAPAEIDDDLGR